jgi:hypothetical protein
VSMSDLAARKNCSTSSSRLYCTATSAAGNSVLVRRTYFPSKRASALTAA